MSILVKMEKIKYRAPTEYLFLKGGTPTQIKVEMEACTRTVKTVDCEGEVSSKKVMTTFLG